MPEMTPERLRALLGSYGAAPDRWPADERPAALALLHADASLAAAFEEEAAFDDLLCLSVVPEPSLDLAHTVLIDVPMRRFRKRLLTWWTGLALAGAGAAGVLCGTAAAAFDPAPILPSYSHNATAFGTIAADSEDL